MRTLYLLRHAKSDWNGEISADFDRPLSKRGFSAAPRMGQFMAESKLIPDRILCSAAKRTRQTLSALQPHFGDEIDIQITDRIYSGNAMDYLNLIRSEGGDCRSLLVIGHNPSTQGLALALSGKGEQTMRDQMAMKYPTAGLCVINFDIEHWSEIGEGLGDLVLFTTPNLIT